MDLGYHIHSISSFKKLPDEIVIREDGWLDAYKNDGVPIMDYIYRCTGVQEHENPVKRFFRKVNEGQRWFGEDTDEMAGRNLYFTVDREAFDKALKDRWMTREDVCSMNTVSLSAIEKMLRSGKVSISMAYHICNRLDMDVERVFGKQGNDSDFERLHIFTKPKKK